MPSIITHHLFGLDVLLDIEEMIGDTKEESDAFLLGNQGPDVLFFSPANPKHARAYNLGSKLHRSNPVDVICAFRDASGSLAPHARAVANAYTQGLVCHYLMDSTVHPFVYAQQYAICDAGIEGLSRADGHEVHAEIESDLDVMVLTTKTGRTIADFDPSRNLLRGNDFVLAVISVLYQRVAWSMFHKKVAKNIYSSGAKAYRALAKALFSPRGVKRKVLGGLERIFRDHSMVQAMSQRNQLLYESDFENRDHAEWVHPGLGTVHTESFWGLYGNAYERALEILPIIPTGSRSDLERALGSSDFNGQPTTPLIVDVKTVEAVSA